MLPGAAAVGAAGGAARGVRTAVRANIVLGLAMAAMALVAATINPGDFFHAQSIEHTAPAPGAQQCTATEADAMDLRGTALLLVLTGVGQAVVASAADVGLVGSLHVRVGSRCLTVWAHLSGAMNACLLCSVVNKVAVVAIGHCAVRYLGNLVFGCAFLVVSYATLLGVSLAVAFC